MSHAALPYFFYSDVGWVYTVPWQWLIGSQRCTVILYVFRFFKDTVAAALDEWLSREQWQLCSYCCWDDEHLSQWWWSWKVSSSLVVVRRRMVSKLTPTVDNVSQPVYRMCVKPKQTASTIRWPNHRAAKSASGNSLKGCDHENNASHFILNYHLCENECLLSL